MEAHTNYFKLSNIVNTYKDIKQFFSCRHRTRYECLKVRPKGLYRRFRKWIYFSTNGQLLSILVMWIALSIIVFK